MAKKNKSQVRQMQEARVTNASYVGRTRATWLFVVATFPCVTDVVPSSNSALSAGLLRASGSGCISPERLSGVNCILVSMSVSG